MGSSVTPRYFIFVSYSDIAVVISTINKRFTFKKLCLEVLSDEKGCIQWLIRRSLLRDTPNCPKCFALCNFVLSVEWRAYRRITSIGMIHKTVNHSVNFVNPSTGTHTQSIESTWAQV